MNNEHKLDTKFGDVSVFLLGEGRMRVGAGSSGQGHIYLLGEPYYVSLFLKIEGDKVVLNDRDPSISRPKDGVSGAPKSYKAKIIAELIERVTQFVAASADLLAQAEMERLDEEYLKAHKEETAAVEALKVASEASMKAFIARNAFRAKHFPKIP